MGRRPDLARPRCVRCSSHTPNDMPNLIFPSYGFGWGRRFCQGSHVAQNSLFIVLARLIWGIDFSAPLDPATGRPVVPDIADEEGTWSEGFVSTPNPFRVKFAPRSERHAQLIREGFDSVQAEWRRMKLDVDQR